MSTETPQSAFIVAVVGAESTGKTTLAKQLAQELARELASYSSPQPLAAQALPRKPRVAWVPETLRQWCKTRGRTPQQHEQAAIAAEQHRSIEAAAAQHDWVVCDTTGLMTAVYSDLIFADQQFHSAMVAWHHQWVDLTLLTALDLPWVPDGHQRDGPQVQGPVDQRLRSLMTQNNLPFSVVNGQHEQRLRRAVKAVQAALKVSTSNDVRAALSATETLQKPHRQGLLTRLLPRFEDAAKSATVEPSPAPGQAWSCECCGDAPYERALRRLNA